jgi:hypothetical protein
MHEQEVPDVQRQRQNYQTYGGAHRGAPLLLEWIMVTFAH